MHILHTVLYKFRNVLKRRIFKNRELFDFELISSILLALMFDLRVTLWGEIRSQSLLGVKALKGKKCWLPCYHSPSQICFLALRLPFHASLLIHLVVYEWHWFFRSENPEPSDVRLQVAIKRRRKCINTAEDHICCSCGSDDDFHYSLRFPKRQLLSPTKFIFTTHLTLAITIFDCLLSYAKSTPMYFTLNITPTHIPREI